MNATQPITITVEIESGLYSPEFLDSVKGSGPWSREVRIVLALAAARGLHLDEAQLILEDARDLRARRDALSRSTAR